MPPSRKPNTRQFKHGHCGATSAALCTKHSCEVHGTSIPMTVPVGKDLRIQILHVPFGEVPGTGTSHCKPHPSLWHQCLLRSRRQASQLLGRTTFAVVTSDDTFRASHSAFVMLSLLPSISKSVRPRWRVTRCRGSTPAVHATLRRIVWSRCAYTLLQLPVVLPKCVGNTKRGSHLLITRRGRTGQLRRLGPTNSETAVVIEWAICAPGVLHRACSKRVRLSCGFRGCGHTDRQRSTSCKTWRSPSPA